MKTIKILLAALAMMTAIGVQAQSVRLPGDKLSVHAPVSEAQKLRLATEIAIRASNARNASFDVNEITSTALSAQTMNQVEMLPTVVEQALANVSFSGAHVVIKTDAASLLDEHTVTVKVQFEERPVGGILNVQVSMTPVFAGVGVTARPIVSRSIAQAVDQMNDEVVKQLVRDLTREMQNEFAAK
jgi:hypothetical protein